MKRIEKSRAGRKGGFTLPELLIVVAIIAVLVAIAIPVFNSQLHKSRVATDWANVRSYYAELQYDFMETEKIDNSKLCGTDQLGLTEFKLSGQTIELKAGRLGVAIEYSDPKDSTSKVLGYNLYYACNDGHDECELTLPEDK